MEFFSEPANHKAAEHPKDLSKVLHNTQKSGLMHHME
jgi:hypothetical protein